MNKRELVNAISDRVGGKQAAAAAVDAVLDAVQKAVASGDKVSITGFGAFEMVHKPSRAARNPSTGAIVQVPESWAPKFRPGSDFKELVNEAGKKAAQAA